MENKSGWNWARSTEADIAHLPPCRRWLDFFTTSDTKVAHFHNLRHEGAHAFSPPTRRCFYFFTSDTKVYILFYLRHVGVFTFSPSTRRCKLSHLPRHGGDSRMQKKKKINKKINKNKRGSNLRINGCWKQFMLSARYLLFCQNSPINWRAEAFDRQGQISTILALQFAIPHNAEKDTLHQVCIMYYSCRSLFHNSCVHRNQSKHKWVRHFFFFFLIYSYHLRVGGE